MNNGLIDPYTGGPINGGTAVGPYGGVSYIDNGTGTVYVDDVDTFACPAWEGVIIPKLRTYIMSANLIGTEYQPTVGGDNLASYVQQDRLALYTCVGPRVTRAFVYKRSMGESNESYGYFSRMYWYAPSYPVSTHGESGIANDPDTFWLTAFGDGHASLVKNKQYSWVGHYGFYVGTIFRDGTKAVICPLSTDENYNTAGHSPMCDLD